MIDGFLFHHVVEDGHGVGDTQLGRPQPQDALEGHPFEGVAFLFRDRAEDLGLDLDVAQVEVVLHQLSRNLASAIGDFKQRGFILFT